MSNGTQRRFEASSTGLLGRADDGTIRLLETLLFTNRHGVTSQTTLVFMTNTEQTQKQTAAQTGQVTKQG